jgi:hypothetical protein
MNQVFSHSQPDIFFIGTAKLPFKAPDTIDDINPIKDPIPIIISFLNILLSFIYNKNS